MILETAVMVLLISLIYEVIVEIVSDITLYIRFMMISSEIVSINNVITSIV
jgi:hypothetical protein